MRLAGAVMAGLLLVGMPAMAQMDSRDAIALQNQILELRQQIQQMQRSGPAPAPIYRPAPGGGDASGLTAQLLDRVATLEDQLRTLRGQMDELANQQQRQAADFNKQIGDLNFAIQNSASNGAAAAPRGQQSALNTQQSPPPSVLGPPPDRQTLSVPPPRTPEVAMQDASAALARRDYPAAEAGAREVIAKRGPRAADAQFLLAQAEMGERNYQQAAPDFYDAYNRARTSPRAPSALLGVANALIALGDRQSACDALAKLRAEFPQPPTEIRDGEANARGRAACR